MNPVTPAACIISQARLHFVIAEYNHELLLKKQKVLNTGIEKLFVFQNNLCLTRTFTGRCYLLFNLQNQGIFGSVVLGFLSCQGTHQKKRWLPLKNFARLQEFKKNFAVSRNHRPAFLNLFLPQHPFLVTHKQFSTPYHWLTPGYYKDKVKINVFLLPPHMWHSQHPWNWFQHPLLVLASQVKKPCHRPSSMLLTSAFSVHDDQYVFVGFRVYF